MGRGLYFPGQWDTHVPADLKEPFPWAHPNYPKSFHPFSRPAGTLAFGVAVMVAGVFLGVTAFLGTPNPGEPGAVATGIFLLLIFGGVGLWGVILGGVRMGWQRRFTKRMGFSPFDRRP